MNFPDAMNLAPECSPVKALPVAVLQVNQNGQDEEHHHAGHDALFVHEGRSSRRERPTSNLPTRSGNGSSKVNECDRRVKLLAGLRWDHFGLSLRDGFWRFDS